MGYIILTLSLAVSANAGIGVFGYTPSNSPAITTTSSITASAFFGDGGHLTGISTGSGESNTFTSSKTFTDSVLVTGSFLVGSGSSVTLQGAAGFFTNTSSVTASAFFGDASHLSNTTSLGVCVTSGTTVGQKMTVCQTGNSNTVSGTATDAVSIMGGRGNSVTGSGGAIAGGVNNTAAGSYSAVLGGGGNTASNQYCTVAGGITGTCSGDFSFVAGGNANTASNQGAFAAGQSAVASGLVSFALGQKAQATHTGAFVWADETPNTAFTSRANDTFNARSSGGFFLFGASITTTGSMIVGSSETVAFGLNVASTTNLGVNSFTVGTSTLAINSGKVSIGTSTFSTPLTLYGLMTSSSTQGSIACDAGTGVLSATCTDSHCTYTAGSGAANCTYTFGTAFPKKPDCFCTDDTSVLAIKPTPQTTTIQCTAAVTMSNDTISFICLGAP